eukprot:m.271209 g.271209  ORF g.271209 m.271209 type:complete len:270 (+) comp19319_c0_seq16:88-897(+)
MATMEEQYRGACTETGSEVNEDIARCLAESTEGVVDLRGKGSLRPLLKPCRVTDQDLPALVQVLGNNTSVTDLSLAYQPITDAGCTTLAQLVEKNTTIQKLSLRSNSFGPAGAEQLAAALQLNTSIKSLGLNGCIIERAGGMAVAATLQINSVLEELDLGNTSIDIPCLIALTTVLNANTTLTTLNIDRPLIKSTQEESIVHFAHCLRVNTGLKSLSLKKVVSPVMKPASFVVTRGERKTRTTRQINSEALAEVEMDQSNVVCPAGLPS